MTYTPGDAVPPGMVARTCPGCGGHFLTKAVPRGRPRVYCAGQCRRQAANARHTAKRRAVDDRVSELLAAPPHPDAPITRPCRWCSAPAYPGDYCSLACESLHDRLLRLAKLLRGLRPSTPIPGVAEQFAELEQLRSARRQLRSARRATLREQAAEKLDREAQVQLDQEARERLRAAAHQRLADEALRKAERVARRKAKKGN